MLMIIVLLSTLVSGLYEQVLHGVIYQNNMVNLTLFIVGISDGVTKEFGMKYWYNLWVTAEARNIGQLTNFAVPVSNTERQVPTGQSKAVTGIPAVVNLNGSGSRPTFHASMRNSNNALRGSTTLLQGQRRTFATGSSQRGHLYWLWMRASNPANTQIQSVSVSGSWSPDCTTAADIQLRNCH